LVFVDAGEDSFMANDVVTPSNLLVTPIEKEKLEEASLGVNVSQWSHDKDLFRKVVCTRINHSA
jgi:hypothetical protein